MSENLSQAGISLSAEMSEQREPGHPLKGKHVFLSGPMSGVEHFNAPEFARAHAICKEAGARHIYDPAYVWLREEDGKRPERTHAEYMRICLHELTARRGFPDTPFYDYLVLLPGWVDSAGARTEQVAARACGITVIDLIDVEDYARDHER